MNLSSAASSGPDRLRIYRDFFETAYVNSLVAFYQTQSVQQLAAGGGVRSYLMYAERSLDDETNRANRYLEPESHAHAIDEAVRVLVGGVKETLLAECRALLNENAVAHLRRLFRLVDRVKNGVDPMLDTFEALLFETGIEKLKQLGADVSVRATRGY